MRAPCASSPSLAAAKVETLADYARGPEVMAPFGPLAFYPARLVHTNELLVHLGGGVYAERTAKQVRSGAARVPRGISTARAQPAAALPPLSAWRLPRAKAQLRDRQEFF